MRKSKLQKFFTRFNRSIKKFFRDKNWIEVIVNLFAGQPKFIEMILNSIIKKPKPMKSKLFTLDTRDLLHGLFVAFLTALITGTIDMLSKGTAFDWNTMKPVLIAGISAALSYILKSLATNSHNQLFRREPV